MQTEIIKKPSDGKPLSFENTEIAFRALDNKNLKRAFWLFNLLNNNVLVKVGPGFVKAGLALGLPIDGLIKATIFKQFCGGESIEESLKTIDALGQYRIHAILDYSIEGEENEKTFDDTAEEIVKTIQTAKDNPLIPFSVFKVTGVGSKGLLARIQKQDDLPPNEKINFQRVKERVYTICKAAYHAGVPVMIDAEESWIQDTIDSIAGAMMEQFNSAQAIVFNTFQMYRTDRLAFLKSELLKARAGNYHLGIKLVRGAYMEKERKIALEKKYPSPIQADKSATDKDYHLAVRFCLQNLDVVSLVSGTHNEDSNYFLASEMKALGLAAESEKVWFAQLLGMSDHLSYNLASQGYQVAKYVPYGPVKAVLPYLFRRAEENTAISGQMGRELTLIKKEMERRKENKNA